MVLEAVYQLLRMFEAHAHGDALGLHGYAFVAEKMIYIACRVAGSEYYRAFPNFAAAVGHACCAAVAVEHYVGHSGAEVHLSAGIYYGTAYSLDYCRKAVGADMRMRVYKDTVLSPVVMENMENLIYRAAFLAACI